ncbi:hypothetical protein LJB99_06075 [Deltaproteobacteria bacterium OttesenSCG-928-K17]|nr:hypothetical protein [Deltaproteobacteria bacterium OttesenSCG-928-K17]
MASPQFGLIVTLPGQVDDNLIKAEAGEISTEHGRVVFRTFDKWAVICRAGFPEENYRQPHEYATAANLAAFKAMGLKEVVGVHSSGSLRPSLAPGTLVVPDDWINFTSPPLTTISGRRCHLTPGFSQPVRHKLADAAWKAEVRFESGGIYWQSAGPRLETKAEIKVMSNFADIVGMGMAYEADLAQEMDLEYAAMCSVDNYANGLGSPALTDETISGHCARNAGLIARVLRCY